MRRREFMARLGAAGAYAAVARLPLARQRTPHRRLIILPGGDDNENQNTTALRLRATFRNELARLGWVVGRNLQVDVRYGGGDPDRMRRSAAELVGLVPDVIVVIGASNLRMVQRQ